MLAKKNKDIKKAYDILKIISKDDKAKMLYEARQAEISDELTRIKSAEDRKAIRIAENLLKIGLSDEEIATASEISIEKVLELKKKMMN